MDLEFTSIELPNGFHSRIRAVPIPLTEDIVHSNGDGRFVVKNNVRREGEYVVGGALGGYVIGSLFHRRITGLFLGTVAGMVAATADRASSENVVVDRGTRMGALFNQDVRLVVTDHIAGAPDRGWDSTGHVDSSLAVAPAPPLPSGGWDSAHSDPAPSRGWDSAAGKHSDTPVAATPPSVSGENHDVSIRFADKTLSFDADKLPYLDGDIVMVPVQQMADRLSVSLEKGDKNSVYLESGDNSVKLEPGVANYRLNGKRFSLSRPPVDKKGTLFAPASIFATLATKELIVNGNRLDNNP
jgi:hypothetical protein